eukprot:SAG31_NODE_4066_length_3623_cov_2.164302_5_plen_118_part_00
MAIKNCCCDAYFGCSAAYDVTLTDESLEEAFTLPTPVSFSFESIASGENETVQTTLLPKESGGLDLGAAKVTYKPTADGPAVVRRLAAAALGPLSLSTSNKEPHLLDGRQPHRKRGS